MATPSAVEERGLVDDLIAATQRLDRLVGSGPQTGRVAHHRVVVDHFRDLAALRPQPVEEAPFVFEPATR